jgi:hypothetical protein
MAKVKSERDLVDHGIQALADALMERVDEHGQVVGFSILGLSRFRKERPFEVELTAGK